ncbi:MAG TPA: hypothetical protein VFU47_17980, partial [Armatimonadota bacterium]|nr:hypothetical protein [Armatimonadota bacterium]
MFRKRSIRDCSASSSQITWGAGARRPGARAPFLAALMVAVAGALAGSAYAPQGAEAQTWGYSAVPGPAGLLARRPGAGGQYQALTQTREFNVVYQSEYQNSFTIPWEWHGSVHDYVMDMGATAQGKITLEGNNGRYWTWSGNLDVQGTYAMDENWYTPRDTLGVVQERASGPDNLGMGMFFKLTLDTETGTYEVLTTDVGLDGTISSNYGEGWQSRPGICQIPCPPHTRPLQSPRPPLVFDDYIETPAPPLWRLADPFTARMHVKYTIGPVGPKPEFLLKQPTANWIPEPDGTIKATVVPKRRDQAPAPVRFILEEITREPGTCLNSPQTDTEPDFDFESLG